MGDDAVEQAVPVEDATDAEETYDGEPYDADAEAPPESEPAQEGVPDAAGVTETGDTPQEAQTSPDEDSALLQRQRAFEEAWARDPLALLQTFAGALPDDQRAKLAEALAPSEEARPALQGYEPASDLEEVLLPHVDTIRRLPEVVGQQVQQELRQVAPYIDRAHLELAILAEKVDALAELAGLAVPTVDREQVYKAAMGGQTFEAAVGAVLKPALKKLVAGMKQSAKPRPRTPGAAAGEMVQLKPGASMADIFEQIG